MKNLLGYFFLFFLSSVLANPVSYTCGHEAEQKPDYYQKLHFGMYWFSHDNQCQKQTKAFENAFLDIHKRKYLIFVHGWSPGMTRLSTRANFDSNALHGPTIDNSHDLIKHWLDDGWNVGLFYWNQFADEINEDAPRDDFLTYLKKAEHKIYASSCGSNADIGLIWKKNDGKTTVSLCDHRFKKGLADVLAEQYIELVEAIPEPDKVEIRLVGESLGTQLVLQAINEVMHKKTGNIKLPDQIILLDPAITKAKLDAQNTVLDNMLANAHTLIDNGIVLSGYRTSNAGNNFLMANNTRVLNLSAFTELNSNFLSGADKHTMGIWYYFWSYSHSFHYNLKSLPKPPSSIPPQARSSIESLKLWMTSNKMVKQTSNPQRAEDEILDVTLMSKKKPHQGFFLK